MQQADFIRNIPFFRLLTPLLLGITFQISNNIAFFNNPIFFIITIVLFSVLIVTNFGLKKYNTRLYYGYLLYPLLFLLGTQLISLKTSTTELTSDLYKSKTFIAKVIEKPVVRPKSVKAVLKLESFQHQGFDEKIDAKVLAYFQKDSLSEKLSFGDLIVINTEFNAITNRGNPYEFDYKRYLAIKKIHFQTRIAAENWRLLARQQANPLIQLADNIRNKLLNILKTNNLAGEEFAVLAALTLGYTADLEDDIKKAYTDSGAMHVLSVSGLHVGVIYMITNFLLQFLYRIKNGRYLAALLCIAVLWFYSLLTGLSPSVVRAATMFTFVTVGNTFNRKQNIYNTIAGSAFILILIEPYLLLDIGFQLSYIAVISIVFFQKLFNNLFEFKFKLFNELWAITSVSIAAQIGTLPISLLYFHQFPNYFLLTNLLIIFLSTFVIYGCIILFFLSLIPKISIYYAHLLEYLVYYMNYFVKFIQQLPYSTATNISFTLTQTVISYIVIIFISTFIVLKRIKYLYLSLISILLFLGIYLIYEIKTHEQLSLTIYNVNNSSVINVFAGKKNILFADSASLNEETAIHYAASSNWMNNNMELPQKTTLTDKARFLEKNYYRDSTFFVVGNKRFAILYNNNLNKFRITSKLLAVDYLILSNNVNYSLEEIKGLFEFRSVIIDSSNKKMRCERWKRECKELDIECFSINDSGAFILNCN